MLKNVECYIIFEFKEYEDKVLILKGKVLVLEKQLYDELFDLLLLYLVDLQQSVNVLVELDVLVNLVECVWMLNYICLIFIDKFGICIIEGCYLVVEQVLNELFIVNLFNLLLQCWMLIIIGFNMGGKSIYMW